MANFHMSLICVCNQALLFRSNGSEFLHTVLCCTWLHPLVLWESKFVFVLQVAPRAPNGIASKALQRIRISFRDLCRNLPENLSRICFEISLKIFSILILEFLKFYPIFVRNSFRVSSLDFLHKELFHSFYRNGPRYLPWIDLAIFPEYLLEYLSGFLPKVHSGVCPDRLSNFLHGFYRCTFWDF